MLVGYIRYRELEAIYLDMNIIDLRNINIRVVKFCGIRPKGFY
jgi:hypothetical protein